MSRASCSYVEHWSINFGQSQWSCKRMIKLQ
jgi:hypothetical protein